MERQITNNEIFLSGAFINNPEAEKCEVNVNLKTVFLTQDGNQSLKDEILKIIESSSIVLKVCSFIITDSQIYEALKKKLETSSVAVFILTQLDTSKISNTSLITEDEAREQTSVQHLSYIKALYDKGAHVRASTIAHAKFLVADRAKGFIMSANFTTPSLNLNTESVAYLSNKCSLELDKLFDVVFLKGTTYRKYLTATQKNKQLIVHNDAFVKQEWLPQVSHSNLRYTYDDLTHNLLEEIISIIKTSKQFIYLSTYSIVGLEHLSLLTTELDCAIKRGVSVFIFCRGMNYRPDHLKGVSILSKIGCVVFADYYNHSKGIINETTGMIFTANVDGYHGLTNGFEVGFILDEIQRSEFLQVHKNLIASSNYKFILTPKRADLFSTYELYEKSKGIKAPVFENYLSISLKKAIYHLKEEFEEHPLFFAFVKGKMNETYIVTANNCFKCVYLDGTITVNEKANLNYNMEKYLLKYQNLKIEYT